MFDADKLEWLGYSTVKNYENVLSRFHLIPERHGQADRFAMSISRVSVLMRDNNYMHVQLSLSLRYYLLYLLLNSCIGNDVKQRVSSADCWCRWQARLLPTAASCVGRCRRQARLLPAAASRVGWCRRQCTHVPASVHKFCIQPATGLFCRHRSGEIKSGVSC